MTIDDEKNSHLKSSAKSLIQDAAPEMSQELSVLWEKYSPNFIYSNDKPGFHLDAGAFETVILTSRTLTQVWLYAHIAWKNLNLYAGFIDVYQIAKKPLNIEEISQLPDQKTETLELKKLLYKLEEFNKIENLEDFSWPNTIPSPSQNRPTENNEHIAIYDLVAISFAFMFLHEIKHIQFKTDNNAPLQRQDEELACDSYAYEYLLNYAHKYSLSTGDNLQKVRSKRLMGITLALFLISEITPNNKWPGSESHPSVVSRIRILMEHDELDENENFWLYLSCLLLTKIQLDGHVLHDITYNSRREFCFGVWGQFELLYEK